MKYKKNVLVSIEVMAIDSAGVGITGLSDVLLQLRRKSDEKYNDFNDNNYKNSGWINRQVQMTEVNSTYSPGKYKYNYITPDANEIYIPEVTCASQGLTWGEDEIEVGDWIFILTDIESSEIIAKQSTLENATYGLEALKETIVTLQQSYNIAITQSTYKTNNEIYIKVGDEEPIIIQVIKTDGTAFDFTDCTEITFNLQNSKEVEDKISITDIIAIYDATQGKLILSPTKTTFTEAKQYNYEIYLVDSNGREVFIPKNKYFKMNIIANLKSSI